MLTHEDRLVSFEELCAVLEAYAGPDEPRERAGASRFQNRLRPLIVAVVAAAALAGAGVGVAAGFGAFSGIGAAQHSQSGTDVLDPQTSSELQLACPSNAPSSIYMPVCNLVLSSARLVGQIPPSSRNLYVVADTRGELCVAVQGGGAGCGSSLSATSPTTLAAANRTGHDLVVYGVALDGVNGVSFRIDDRDVTVPVKDNVWAYETATSATLVSDATVHLDDGKTISLDQ
jgi:hypothetical protein